MVKYLLAVTIMCGTAAQADEISPSRGDALRLLDKYTKKILGRQVT